MWKIYFFVSLYFCNEALKAQNIPCYLPEFQAEWGFRYAYAFSNNWAVEKKPDGTVRYFR